MEQHRRYRMLRGGGGAFAYREVTRSGRWFQTKRRDRSNRVTMGRFGDHAFDVVRTAHFAARRAHVDALLGGLAEALHAQPIRAMHTAFRIADSRVVTVQPAAVEIRVILAHLLEAL